MNNMDEFLKFLIPAFFLVLWALNQLLNKENAPPQAAGRPGSLGPRPGGLPPAPRPADRARTAPTSTPARPSASSTPPPGRDDDIVILRSETIRPAPGARGGNRARSGRAGRPKPSGPPAEVPGRAAGRPSVANVAPTVDPSIATTQGTQGGPLLIGIPTRLSGPELRKAFGSLEGIREAILINEVLQPPVSRRGRRRP